MTFGKRNRRRCENCYYRTDNYRCRVNPPVILHDLGAKWPIVQYDDYCGRWRSKESFWTRFGRVLRPGGE